MKTSIFLTSFFSMYCSGSKLLTSPAMRVEKAEASKRVMGPMPLCPSQSASQFASVPMPSADTSPMPVTTTRRGLAIVVQLLVGAYFLPLPCDSMYSTASLTRVIFSASSSGISMPNSSSNAITSSTVSSESAPRSSTNDASGVTSSSSTPNCSTMMLLTLSATAIQASSLPVPQPCRILLPANQKSTIRGFRWQNPRYRSHVHATIHGQHLTGDICCLI